MVGRVRSSPLPNASWQWRPLHPLLTSAVVPVPVPVPVPVVVLLLLLQSPLQSLPQVGAIDCDWAVHAARPTLGYGRASVSSACCGCAV